jgi:hypothetical protein
MASPAYPAASSANCTMPLKGGKEVYVIWACRGTPSPFITETATRVFCWSTRAP